MYLNYVRPIIDLKITSQKARRSLYKISLKDGYWDISKSIYEKHGSRKSAFNKKANKKINKKSFNKQFELNLNL